MNVYEELRSKPWLWFEIRYYCQENFNALKQRLKDGGITESNKNDPVHSKTYNKMLAYLTVQKMADRQIESFIEEYKKGAKA